MRREFKLGVLIFAIFNFIRFIAEDILKEVPEIHFILGVLAAMSLVYIMIGTLPENTYLKIKSLKRNLISFIK